MPDIAICKQPEEHQWAFFNEEKYAKCMKCGRKQDTMRSG